MSKQPPVRLKCFTWSAQIESHLSGVGVCFDRKCKS